MEKLKRITRNWTDERALGFNLGIFAAFFFAGGMINGAQGNLGLSAFQFVAALLVMLVAVLLPAER